MKRKIRILFAALGFVAAGVILAVLVQRGLRFRIYCPVYELTGLQCPGCGNTRATLALLRLDFKAMLTYNLLYPLEMLYIGWVGVCCVRNYLRGGRFSYRARPGWLDYTCIALILLWTVVRNCIRLL